MTFKLSNSPDDTAERARTAALLARQAQSEPSMLNVAPQSPPSPLVSPSVPAQASEKPARTYENLMRAAWNADKAGDEDAARKLVRAAQDLQGEQGGSVTPEKEKALQRQGQLRRERLMRQAHDAMTRGDNPEARRLIIEAQKIGTRSPAIGSGPSTFEIKTPGGEVYEVQGEDAEGALAALKQHLGDSPKAEGSQSDTTENKGILGSIKDHARGLSSSLADGAMLGLGDEYLAGVSAVLGVTQDGKGGQSWFNYDQPLGERYDSALSGIRKEQAGYSEAHPAASIAAEMTGALIGPGKGVSAASKATTTAGRVARASVAGGATAAAYGYGEGEGSAYDRAVNAAQSAPVGLVGGAGLSLVGQGLARAVGAVRGRPGASEALPSLESLRETARGLYAAAEASGAKLTGGQVKAMSKVAEAAARRAGYDKDLHPRVAAVLRRLSEEKGEKSFAEMEIIRRVASNAAASLQPDERRVAMTVMDEIDRMASKMGGAAETGKAARAVYARMRRMERVEELIEKATTYKDFEDGLKSVFRTMIRNPKNLRGFTAEEVKAMQAIAKGSRTRRGLETLSRLLSINTISGVGLAGGAAVAAGGPAALLPIAGWATGKVADGMTRGAARNLQRAVSGAPPAPSIASPGASLGAVLGANAEADDPSRAALLDAMRR